MSDGRRRRRAKKARRDIRRAKARDRTSRDIASFVDVVRGALNCGHPLGLPEFGQPLDSHDEPDPFSKLGSGKPEPIDLDDLIVGLRRVQEREITALLAVLAELTSGETQDCFRREVVVRNDSLPQWISGLARIEVHRVVQATHVLGDEDELLIGVQLTEGYELTCVVHLDHNMLSKIDDAYFVPESIDKVLSGATDRNTDPDVSFVDMSLADARAWIDHGLEHALFPRTSDSWPDCRALVEWLTLHLPEGGAKFETREWDYRHSWSWSADSLPPRLVRRSTASNANTCCLS